MINSPPAELDHVTQKFAAAFRIFLNCFVCRGNGVNVEAVNRHVPSCIQANGKLRNNVQAIAHELAIRFRNNDVHLRVGLKDWDQRFCVEMIRVIVR